MPKTKAERWGRLWSRYGEPIRCTHGPRIDGELFGMTCRDRAPGCGRKARMDAPYKPLDEDQSREFLNARYHADLSDEGLDESGFPQIRPEDVQDLDSVDHANELPATGAKAGQHVELAHFGSFA